MVEIIESKRQRENRNKQFNHKVLPAGWAFFFSLLPHPFSNGTLCFVLLLRADLARDGAIEVVWKLLLSEESAINE